MAKPQLARNIVLGIAAIALASAMGIQATSIVTERTNPITALQVNPNNGSALGRLALAQFTAEVAEGQAPENAAKKAETIAKSAVLAEPLNSRAHAVLAWAADDAEKRDRILENALKLNRRSSPVQALSLQERTQAGDMEGSIESLDQILRVHPETSEQFFPVLADALNQDETLEGFGQIMAYRPPWQDRFLNYAANRNNTIVNATRLRRTVEIEDEKLDKKLIDRLVKINRLPEAYQHYAFLMSREENAGRGKFESKYPPIDWKFAADSGMRAQPAGDNESIELYLRGGQGGIMMQRLLPSNGDTARFEVEHDVTPSVHWPNMGLRVSCAGTQDVLFDQKFPADTPELVAEVNSRGCTFLEVALYARAFTGNPVLRGNITRFSLN